MDESKEKREVLLRVEGLCQYFYSKNGEVHKAVDDVSFDIRKGEVFGLVGESGCGKTTTGRSILRIYPLTAGSVYFKGQRICAGTRSYVDAIRTVRKETAEQIRTWKNDPQGKEKIAQCKVREKAVVQENRRKIKEARRAPAHSDKVYADQLVKAVDEKYTALLVGAKTAEEKAKWRKEYRRARKIAGKSKLITQIQMIFQDPSASLNPRMTVREIIAEGLVVNGVTDQAYIEEKVVEILETVGLSREHAGRYPHEFSGGQQQRIGIARSIILEPALIIADEPISALDVSIQAQVINLLNELRENMGVTILFIAHDLSVVKYFSDRIGVMYLGKLVELASSEELFAHPLHPYTKALLSAIPYPDPRYEKRRTRTVYRPKELTEQSSLREIAAGHWVYCNPAEEQIYRKELER